MRLSSSRALFLTMICFAVSSTMYLYTREILLRKYRKSRFELLKGPHSFQRHDSIDNDPYDVMILTYMRSGSTFIGHLLGSRKDTFYWYEPLWATHKYRYHSSGQLICKHGMDDCKNVTKVAKGSIDGTLNFLLDIYKCNLTGHYKRFSEEITVNPLFSGATARTYQNCITAAPECKECVKANQHSSQYATTLTQCLTCSENATRSCFNQWLERCHTSSHRTTKVLRMSTTHAHYLLQKHKRLKLVQIFRDPRAIINSGKNVGWYARHKFSTTSEAEVLCKRIEDDIQAAEKLKILYPGRVKIIQYEDFNDPYAITTMLYDFLNMGITDSVKRSLLIGHINSTNIKVTDGFHPDSFRYQLDWESIASINEKCQKVINTLGLRLFKSESEVQDKTVDIMKDKLPYSLT